MKSTDQPYEMPLDGYQTVFTGGQTDGMKRGYHYTFGFKVRMQVENTSILYPDEYKQQIVGGIGMLSSLSVGAPRQSTSVSMYLKDTIGDGTDANPYKTIWQMNVLIAWSFGAMKSIRYEVLMQKVSAPSSRWIKSSSIRPRNML